MKNTYYKLNPGGDIRGYRYNSYLVAMAEQKRYEIEGIETRFFMYCKFDNEWFRTKLEPRNRIDAVYWSVVIEEEQNRVISCSSFYMAKREYLEYLKKDIIPTVYVNIMILNEWQRYNIDMDDELNED